MQDFRAQREKFLTDAAECEMISNLATDKEKRDIFRKLADDLRKMVADLEAAMAGKQAR
jgi:hypothetical protein